MFNDVIHDLHLQELPLLDRLYTWSNNQQNPTLVRLDRALVNNDWNLSFPDCTLTSRTRTTSDHVPLVLKAATSIPKSTLFRFNNHWLLCPRFLPIVEQNWNSVLRSNLRNNTAALCLRLKRVRAATKIWERQQKKPKDVIHNCEIVIALLDKLEEFRVLSGIELRLRLLVKISLQHHTTLLAAFWKQRGKIKECMLGDENTKYFQMSATIRHRNNQIRMLDPEDTPVFSHSGKEAILHRFYLNLLGVRDSTTFSFDLNSLTTNSSLDSHQSNSLVSHFTLGELKSALWAMKDDSSPGPDGFGPAFYKKNWNLVKHDLLALLYDFYKSEADLKRINKSHIVLIPKKPGVTKPEHFRPISLQNCPVKIA